MLVALALPLNLCLLYSSGAGLGWKKSVFESDFTRSFYFVLCHPNVKMEFVLEFKIVME